MKKPVVRRLPRFRRRHVRARPPAVLPTSAPPAGTAPGAAPAPAAQEIAAAAVERTGLLPEDLVLLDDARHKWQHLQTAHFVLHHDQKMFAAKVARLGEQFYAAISADLPNLRDRISPARSHVFIFRDPQEWKAIVAATPGMETWAASFVRNQAMYLQETARRSRQDGHAGARNDAPGLQPLPDRAPAAVAQRGPGGIRRGIRVPRRQGHGPKPQQRISALRQWTPLAELLAAADYPADPEEVSRFYATSKYLVGYLLLKQPREKWDAFFGRVLAGEPALPALLETYGWADVAAAEKAFAQFAR
jgi:hypothetical protein